MKLPAARALGWASMILLFCVPQPVQSQPEEGFILPVPPLISDPGDIIVGDLENSLSGSTSTNIFVYPDAIRAGGIVIDDITPDHAIRWSFTSSTGAITINGVGPLDPSLMGLNEDDPTSPRLDNRLDLNNLDPGGPFDPEDGDPFTFTFRNSELTPDNTTPAPGPPGLVEPPTSITLFASDGATFGMRTLSVYTIRGESDSISSGIPPCFDCFVDFTTTIDGWIGGALPGFGGSVASGAEGLCMSVPAVGSNQVLWVSPESYLELVDNSVYRLTADTATDQTSVDAIPLWLFAFDNFSFDGNGNNYGGFSWMLDVDGGAQGIGRPNGRNMYDFWFVPNSVGLPQWRDEAFSPAADFYNDMRLMFQVNDSNESLLTQNDSGTICIRSIFTVRINRDFLDAQSVPLNAPLQSNTHFILNVFNSPGTIFDVHDPGASMRFDLGGIGDVLVQAGYFDSSLPTPQQQLYPVIWEANSLYRTRSSIRSLAAESDPVDAIFLSIDTANNELGMASFTTRSGGSVMNLSASPKVQPHEYEAYFYSQNATDSVVVDQNRLRPQLLFFNTTSLFGDGTGMDAFEAQSLEVDKLYLP